MLRSVSVHLDKVKRLGAGWDHLFSGKSELTGHCIVKLASEVKWVGLIVSIFDFRSLWIASLDIILIMQSLNPSFS